MLRIQSGQYRSEDGRVTVFLGLGKWEVRWQTAGGEGRATCDTLNAARKLIQDLDETLRPSE